jgi:hypothetical protein
MRDRRVGRRNMRFRNISQYFGQPPALGRLDELPHVASQRPTYREISHLNRTCLSKKSQDTDLSGIAYGFDSHHPLHSQATPGKPRQQRRQDPDHMGDFMAASTSGRLVSLPWVAVLCPSIRTHSRTCLGPENPSANQRLRALPSTRRNAVRSPTGLDLRCPTEAICGIEFPGADVRQIQQSRRELS